MATKKLSEVHYALPDRGKVVDTDRIIINQNSTTTDATLKVSTLLAEADTRAQAKADAAKADAIAADPKVQNSTQGTSGRYIYSTGGDQNTYTAITSKIWTYTHNDGHLFLRFKHWGGNNDTNFTNASQVMLPQVWVGGDGVLHRSVYKRIDAFSLREENSTATEVNIVTPIFTTGGTRSFTISAATTAKAGVMTAADRALLNQIKEKLGL